MSKEQRGRVEEWIEKLDTKASKLLDGIDLEELTAKERFEIALKCIGHTQRFIMIKWTQLQPIAPAASTAIQRIAPRLKYEPVQQLWNLTCIEYDNGVVSGITYQYPCNRQSTDLIPFSSGSIFHDISCLYGAYILHVAALSGVTGDILISQPTLQFAGDYSQSNANQYVDLSNYILSYIRIDHTEKPNELELVLDNNKGQLSSLIGIPTSTKPTSGNTTLVLSEGYKTGSPPHNGRDGEGWTISHQ